MRCRTQFLAHLRRAGLLVVSPSGSRPFSQKEAHPAGARSTQRLHSAEGREQKSLIRPPWPLVALCPEEPRLPLPSRRPPNTPPSVTLFSGPQLSLAWSSSYPLTHFPLTRNKTFSPSPSHRFHPLPSPVDSLSCSSALPLPLSKLLSVLSWIKDVNAPGRCSPYLLLLGPFSPVSTGQQQKGSIYNFYLLISLSCLKL